MEMVFRFWFLLITVLFRTGLPSLEEACTIEIEQGSELYLKGYANIRDFNCAYTPRLLERSVPVTFRSEGRRTVFGNAVIRLDTRGFDCGGKGINKDFYELLQTGTYPHIRLELKETVKEAGEVKALISMAIAGVEREYTIPVDLTGGKSFRCSGTLRLNINDFGLEPPKKMLGLIVVREDIEIYFDLDLCVQD
ncbi:YceI family protein [Sinomicrobium weinanense]|uniref:YceI family protein n=1 Tax=Sinomicrobium weinanense TaxID=2842200 RepID=A0A926JWN2_9FLAO|nr:YceI family protein [Sinomicrobium weinanense]MBC9798689.1 YceI family protein [Sinomicrobium weinanense]MBU3121794.1 YceI family protein [Sinomicrobium weinanense]